MVTNLLDNAIRHNTNGGHVVITTDSAADAHLRVTNTGQHIEPDDVDRLFEPFVRGSTNHPRTDNGVGLGLSIVRAIVDAHHGQLTAAPRPSGGMEITICLPGRRFRYAALTSDDVVPPEFVRSAADIGTAERLV